MKNKPVYYVSECPETGKQFLCQVGIDGNIAELNPATVASMLVTFRLQQDGERLSKQTKKLLKSK
jgi:hypothetical protein